MTSKPTVARRAPETTTPPTTPRQRLCVPRTPEQAEARYNRAFSLALDMQHDLGLFDLALTGALRGIIEHGIDEAEAADGYASPLWSAIEGFQESARELLEAIVELDAYYRPKSKRRAA